MQLHAYLSFDGRCEEAFNFYSKALGGEIIVIMRNGDSPMAKDMPAELHRRVMHARIRIGEQIVMASDTPAGDMQKPQWFNILLSTPDPAEAERLYQALQPNAEIRMPLQETFWALRFGMLTDQFGTPWMINCEKPMPA